MKTNYEQRVYDFNQAAGASYIADIHFLRFRKTTKGIKVGCYAGKPEEVSQLREDVERAGSPYYCKF